MSNTKEEIYNELVKRGIQPKKSLRFSKIEDLHKMLDESNPKQEQQKQNPDEKKDIPPVIKETKPAPEVKLVAVQILPLRFETSGWCEELCCSYYAGVHHCATVREYEALKKYSVKK